MSKQLKRKLILTEDGSHTLYVPELDEHYHSIHGAIQESMHVFIESGLNFIKRENEIAILEIGFGTGLNALLTFNHTLNSNKDISYTSIEKYPITEEEISSLNYSNLQNDDKAIFMQLHKADWGKKVAISKHFYLHKVKTDLLDYKSSEKFDLVYFDAFAPSLQPDLWSAEVFAAIYKNMNPNGVVVTYSAKGFVKRNLKSAGFLITKIPGPPGKREMIRAIKVKDEF